MPFTPFMARHMLNWVTGAAAATQPSQRFVQFATASPDATSAFDGPFSTRNTVTFAAAASPAGSITNANTCTVCTATASATAVGWNLYDASVGGNRLAYGTLSANIGCKSADQAAFIVGGLKIVLS